MPYLGTNGLLAVFSCSDQINLEQEDDSLSHVPTMEEMEEFKRRMGIQSVVPPMGSPGLSRPSSAGQRPCSGAKAHPSSALGMAEHM